jgi:hypothetical protein
MGTRHSRALLSLTRSKPLVLRQMATRVVGTAMMASPDGSTPACDQKNDRLLHPLPTSTCLRVKECFLPDWHGQGRQEQTATRLSYLDGIDKCLRHPMLV